MPLSRASQLKALHALFDAPLMLGLLTGDREMAVAGYERQPVTMRVDEAALKARNASLVRFPPFRAAATVDGWLLLGSDGAEVCRHPIAAKTFDAYDEAVWRAGDLAVAIGA